MHVHRLLLVATLLLAACGAPEEAPAPAAEPEPCPPTVSLTVDRVVPVPADPPAETLGRLVPAGAPSAALVCRYPGAALGARAQLAGEVELAAGLDGVPQDLLLPSAPSGPGAGPCVDPEGAVVDAYLLRLAYDDGVVWVSGLDGSPCGRTTNGVFVSGEARGDVLAASHAAGAWTVPPQQDAGQRCAPGRTGRLGQEFALLPPGATGLVLCRVAGDGVTRRSATAAQRAQVQEVLDAPVATRDGAPCAPAPGLHELVATYPTGPAVQVTFAPGCATDVDNGSLQARLEPAGRARLEAVLSEAFGGGDGRTG